MIAPSVLAKGDTVTSDDVVGGVGGSGGWPVHLHFSLYSSKPDYGSGGPEYPGNTLDPLDYMDITVSTGGTDWDPSHAH